jgi:trehalose synthase
MKPLSLALTFLFWAVSVTVAAQNAQPVPASQLAERPAEQPQRAEGPAYIRWLEERSMLHQAQIVAQHYSGSSAQWQHPYGIPQPRAATSRASVWFTAYPASTIAAAPSASVLTTLADERLWRAFQTIGIQGIHTSPMKRSGGVQDLGYTPSIDGNFDRISLDIDPDFGTEAQYKNLVATARAHGAVVIGDVVPGHTGKGPDFRLAERAYADYPGLYHMVRIDPADWNLLPPVTAGRDSVNLSPAIVNALQAKGYIVGMLASKIFYEPGVKDSDWSATDIVRGVDGVQRRWVYLHYFKQGQPTLNWLDPSFAAERLVLGDAVHEIGVLGDGGVRLDANGLLGIERDANGRVWSEGHPLSVTANQLIGDMVRKLGGFTFQELALPLDDLRTMSAGGPDLSYDFFTRPAYDHALLTGDAEFLRLVHLLMRKYEIDTAGLIHALQNHDELTMGIGHFAAHGNELFPFRGQQRTGKQIRDIVRAEMYARLLSEREPYNLKFGDGVASTTATVVMSALGLRNITRLSTRDVEKIKRLHLLLAFYNAFQPGVFALSGWDLVGALTLSQDAVRERLADGDTRWINRGAYDLIGSNPRATRSSAGLQRTKAIYGPLPQQLEKADSFASRLARMLKARAAMRLYAARLVDIPDVRSRGLFVLIHELPENGGLEVTAINFGATPVDEAITVRNTPANAEVRDVLEPESSPSRVTAAGQLPLKLPPYTGVALQITR